LKAKNNSSREEEMIMLYSEVSNRMFSLVVLTVLFSMFSIVGFGEEPVPILEYLFNETGTVVFSSGSKGLDLKFQKKEDGQFFEADLHTEGGLGVSGNSDDRAFDNYSWCEPFKGGNALAAYDSELLNLRSFTLQGWYKVDQDGLQKESRICAGPFLVCCYPNSLGFGVSGRVFSTLKYKERDEWVFFAVTFDNTQAEPKDNVKFYVGTKDKEVELVSAHSHYYAQKRLPSNSFWVGAHAGGNYAFYGFLDNIRLFGSDTDAKGVLTIQQLEAIRRGDIKR
jgi:hypothetical protein